MRGEENVILQGPALAEAHGPRDGHAAAVEVCSFIIETIMTGYFGRRLRPPSLSFLAPTAHSERPHGILQRCGLRPNEALAVRARRSRTAQGHASTRVKVCPRREFRV